MSVTCSSKIKVTQELGGWCTSTIEVPFGWEQVEEWFVKWDTLHYKLKNEQTWKEICLNSNQEECIDWKRPNSTVIRDEHDNLLAEDE